MKMTLKMKLIIQNENDIYNEIENEFANIIENMK